MPGCEVPSLWCCRILYLPIFDVADTLCRPPCITGCLVLLALHIGPGWPGRKSPFEVEVRVFEQDLIPHVGQVVLANVPVKGLIIDMDYQQLVCMGSCNITNLVPDILEPGASLCITNNNIYGKYNIFPQTWRSHVVYHSESLSVLQYFSVLRNLKGIFFSYIWI